MNNIVNEKGHNFDEVCEGNVFTGVCPQGGLCPRGVQGVSVWGVSVQGISAQGEISVQGVSVRKTPLWQRASGTHYTEMLCCFLLCCASLM